MNKQDAKRLDEKLGKTTHKADRAGGGSLDKRVDSEILQLLRENNKPIDEPITN